MATHANLFIRGNYEKIYIHNILYNHVEIKKNNCLWSAYLFLPRDSNIVIPITYILIAIFVAYIIYYIAI